ncbi:MAG: P13 family porin [Spirochaetaceae bacterium]|jgi:hypothetical protein|nr:P13 family porin [Spirochaetaceae bacterium]
MKGIVVFIAVCLIGGFCFAQESEAYEEIRDLLGNGLTRNFDEIYGLSPSLTAEEGERLFQDFAFPRWKRWAGPLMNGAIGFGVGSFVQKDFLWGGILLGADILASAAVYVGAQYLLAAGIGSFFIRFGATEIEAKTQEYLKTGFILVFGGLGWYLANRAVGIIRACVYPSRYDGKLKRALNLDVVSVIPEPAVSSSGIGVALVRLRF